MCCVWSAGVDYQGGDVVGLLEGKVAVVTGAGSGIGRSEALTLATHGAAVVVNDVGQSAHDVAAEISAAGGQAVANRGDVTQWNATRDLVDQAVEQFGSLDIVVTNAGIVRRSAIIDVTEADLDAQMAVLFKGTYSLLRHAGAYWRRAHESGERKHRAVVTTSSNGGIPGGVQEFTVYGGMKAAIATVTLGAALEFRRFGVSVNSILPHAATRMDAAAKGLADFERFEPEDMDVMNPQHVANVVAYLASERAAWLTGQIYEITGTNVRRWLPWSAALEVESETQWTPDNLDDALAQSVYGTLPGGRIVQKR
jgi:NAD(P)-dependent dehydrogenase (short-subunit alcohol dehydrogenase family)